MIKWILQMYREEIWKDNVMNEVKMFILINFFFLNSVFTIYSCFIFFCHLCVLIHYIIIIKLDTGTENMPKEELSFIWNFSDKHIIPDIIYLCLFNIMILDCNIKYITIRDHNNIIKYFQLFFYELFWLIFFFLFINL